MKFILGHSKIFGFLMAFGLVTIFFQNCSPVQFNSGAAPDIVDLGDGTCASDPTKCPPAPAKCTFNGASYDEGQTITAYLYSSVPTGQTCTSETRVCTSGSFTGSYPYATCSVGVAASCLFNGQTIASGATVKAYQNSSVAYGQTCASQDRLCTNGVLSGSYNFASCSAGTAASCLFNGQTIAHGASVIAYPTSSVAYGQVCQSTTRVCSNGTLSGTGNFATCNSGGAASCLFNGQSVAHGGSVIAYQNSSVGYGQVCASQNRTCNNGTLSGSYNHTTCNAGGAASCLFNGNSVAHGQTVTAYQSSTVGYGQSCVSQSRTCTNGTLSGSYTFGSCNSGSAASCLFNGLTVANGASVTAYQTSTVPFGQSCSSQSRLCTNGTLSGNYAFPSCSSGGAASCNFNGVTVSHGQTVVAYASSSVGFGQACAAQNRSCNNGTLSGTYAYSSCSVGTATACYFNGQSISHGGSVYAYAAASVPYGQQCQGQTRNCNNGTLGGSYSYPTCSPQPPPSNASCNFNGVTIAHGGSVTAYASSSVPYGQSCQSQTRTCNNGNLSGSYGASSCSPQAAAACQYGGGTLAWGVNNACSVYAGALTLNSGGSRSFSSTSGTGQGSVAFSCTNGAFEMISQNCTPVVTVISITPYCQGSGCQAGCGMWERGEIVTYSNGTTERRNQTTGGANDCGA